MKNFRLLTRNLLQKNSVATILPTLARGRDIICQIQVPPENLILIVDNFTLDDLRLVCSSLPLATIVERARSFGSAEEVVWSFVNEFSTSPGEVFFWLVIDEMLTSESLQILNGLMQDDVACSVPVVNRIDRLFGCAGRVFRDIGRFVSIEHSRYEPGRVHGSLSSSFRLGSQSLFVEHTCFQDGSVYFPRMYSYILAEISYDPSFAFFFRRYVVSAFANIIRAAISLRPPLVSLYYFSLDILSFGMAIYAYLQLRKGSNQ